jgi:hypothetical protein
MLYKDLKSLDELDMAKEAERLIMAKTPLFTSGFNFLKILKDLVKAAAF